MKYVNVKNLAIAAVPLVICGLAWVGFNKRSQSAAAPEATAAPVDPATAAPQDPAHEKAALEEELKKKPGHAPILLRLAEMEREAGRIPQVVTYLQQASQNDPGNEDVLLELGRAQFEVGDFEGALKSTERLVKDHPNNVDGLYNLGALHANLGHDDKAKEYWTKANQVDPGSESGKKALESIALLADPSHATSPHGNSGTVATGSPAGRGDAIDILLKHK